MTKEIDFPTETVEEGKIRIVVPKLKAFIKSPSEYAPSKAPVFYNPIMELNRDIATIVLQAYQRMLNRPITICEPLTGCGVRAIRYAKEIEGIQKIVTADINEKAFKLASYNIKLNNQTKRVTVKNTDANRLLANYSRPRKRFDIIDIDPFGSPVPFLDSAIRALKNNGLLALTATDLAPLCGVHPKACIRKYGGKPLRTEYCHELAIRLLAGCLVTTAAKQEIGIRVLFSHSTDHYIRLYATIAYGAKKADETLQSIGHVLHCFNCFHRETQKGLSKTEYPKQCGECHSSLNFAGPLWLGELFNKQFCTMLNRTARQKTLKNKAKILKILSLIEEEAEAPPTYYVLDAICDKLGLPVPPVKHVFNMLKEKGFHATYTHFTTKGIHTNASATELKATLIEALNH